MLTAVFDFDTPIVSAAFVCQYNYTAEDSETGEYLGTCVSQKDFYKQSEDKFNKLNELAEEGKIAPHTYTLRTKDNTSFSKSVSLIDDLDFDIIKRGQKVLKGRVEQILRVLKPDVLHLVIGGKGNFRNDVATIQPYKGNRGDKPLLTQALKDWVATYWEDKVIVSSGEEADDIVSRFGWGAYYKYGANAHKHMVMVHVDKDLNQIPGRHYNPDTGLDYIVTARKATYEFLKSTLLGDKTDNILGLSGLPEGVPKMLGVSRTKKGNVGEKTAEKLLDLGDGPRDWWSIVVWCYKIRWEEKWLEVLTENCRLLYLRRTEDEIYDLGSFLKGIDLL